MLEENIKDLVDNLITSLLKQCYDVASSPDSGPHRSEFCEAFQEGIMHWKPSEKLLEEEVTYILSETSKPRAQAAFCYNFSLPWRLLWGSLCLLIV
ncbi:Receptor-transporting protein 2 [Sciurus carolinensis]|uniref:Receptor-transporting protein 2 n=1 Tax=Sciurus carolinensis TaxID=30640 RepID=A0AA41MMG5_SCICA|nr:Receptor-transporting protein 2 [Sciurus carolinensis]